jgi:hypothetical protein
VREALGATVGKIAVAITTGEMPYHPPVEVPLMQSITRPPAGTDVGGIKAKLYYWQIEQRERIIQDETVNQAPRAFALLLKCIPTCFLVEIEATEDYETDVYDTQNFLELIRRLKRVAGPNPTDPVASDYAMRMQYKAAVRQGKEEPLENYYQRVRQIVDRCKKVYPDPVDIGNDQRIAMDFLGGSDHARYKQNKVDLQNAINDGLARWPADLHSAYLRLKDYIVPITKASRETQVSGSVFTITKSEADHDRDSGYVQKQSSRDPPKDKKFKEPKAAQGKKFNNSKPQPPPKPFKPRPPRDYGNLQCPFCKLKGHRMLDCPQLKECEEIRQSKLSGTALLTHEDPDSDDDIANYAYSASNRNHSAFMVKIGTSP